MIRLLLHVDFDLIHQFSSLLSLTMLDFHCACLDLLTLDLLLLFLILRRTKPSLEFFTSPGVIFGRAASQIYLGLPSCVAEVHPVNGSWAISPYSG